MIYNILAKVLKAFSIPVIRRQRPKVIGITGSVGKTSTKEAIYTVLRKNFGNEVKKAYENLNTDVGLPLAILMINTSPQKIEWVWVLFVAFIRFLKYRFFSKNYPKILILEYAADKPGDIARLTEIVKSDIAVVTEVGPTHLEKFKTKEAVLQDKMELVKRLKPDGIAVLNKDNKLITEYAKNIRFKIVWFHGSNIECAKNVARAVGKILGIPEVKINAGVADIKPIKGRLNIFQGIKNTTLIDDTYNASPLSMKLALKSLGKYKDGKRKVAILGDMRELGKASRAEHQKLANMITKNAQFAILIGPEISQYTSPELKKKKFKHFAFKTFTDARKIIIDNITKQDVILIKASQNTLFLERVTEMLLMNKKDIFKLCRQEPHWLKIKSKTP